LFERDLWPDVLGRSDWVHFCRVSNVISSPMLTATSQSYVNG